MNVKLFVEKREAYGDYMKNKFCGDTEMPSKVSENQEKRTKYNKFAAGFGGLLLLIGIALLVIKGMSVEYIDADGILHENFFLIPCGFFCIGCGLISFLTIGIREVIHRLTKHG